MHDIIASGQRFSDHFYGKPTTGRVAEGLVSVWPTILELCDFGLDSGVADGIAGGSHSCTQGVRE